MFIAEVCLEAQLRVSMIVLFYNYMILCKDQRDEIHGNLSVANILKILLPAQHHQPVKISFIMGFTHKYVEHNVGHILTTFVGNTHIHT